MAPAAGQDAPEAGPQCTVLAWDERMTLHAEGRHNPHPERPDRLRAVMARLLDSGLAGAFVRLTLACSMGRTGVDIADVSCPYMLSVGITVLHSCLHATLLPGSRGVAQCTSSSLQMCASHRTPCTSL